VLERKRYKRVACSGRVDAVARSGRRPSGGAANQALPLIRAGSNGITDFEEPSKNAYGVCLTTLAA
jgi:hypothetical protein